MKKLFTLLLVASLASTLGIFAQNRNGSNCKPGCTCSCNNCMCGNLTLEELLNSDVDYTIHDDDYYAPTDIEINDKDDDKPEYYGDRPMTWRDEAPKTTIEQLMPNFTKTTLSDGSVRYMPKTATFTRSENAMFFYFDVDKNGNVGPLRYRTQYYADDPLSIKGVDLFINNFHYRFMPAKVEKGKDQYYWEQFDEAFQAKDKDFVYATAHAQYIVVKFLGGDGFNHVKDLQPGEKEAFGRTLDLFKLMGGKIE